MKSLWLCVPCRLVGKLMTICPRCGSYETIPMGSKWRAPKKSNEKAWKFIEAGDYLWDKKAVAKKQREYQDKTYWLDKLLRDKKARKRLLDKNS